MRQHMSVKILKHFVILQNNGKNINTLLNKTHLGRQQMQIPVNQLQINLYHTKCSRYIKSMKGKSFILVAILAIAIVNSTQINVKPSASNIQRNRDWTRVKIGLEGGSPPYSYKYDQYPKDWKQTSNYLYIPSKSVSQKTKYPCKFRAYDQRGNEVKKTIILTTDENKNVQVSDQIFDYNYQFNRAFYTQGGYSGVPEMVKNEFNAFDLKSAQRKSSKSANNAQIIKDIESLSKTAGAGSGTAGITNVINQIYSKSEGGSFDLGNVLNALNPYSSKYQDSKSQQFLSKIRGSTGYWERTTAPAATGFDNGFSFGDSRGNSRPQVSEPQVYYDEFTGSFTKASGETIRQQDGGALYNLFSLRSALDIGGQSSLSVPIDKIFLRLPNSQQLDEIILSTDYFLIIKTIQNVIKSDLSCEQKVSYLQDFFGRIESAIEMKTFAANQLRVIIQAAKVEIERLESQILLSATQIQRLGIKQAKERLVAELNKLEKAYNAFNANEAKIEPNKAKIAGYQRDIEIQREKAVKQRALLQAERLKEVQIDGEVTKIQLLLAQAKQRQKAVRTTITNYQRNIQKYENQITSDRTAIIDLQIEIDDIEFESDRLRLQYLNLQIIVQRLQKNIIRDMQRQDAIQARLDQLEARLALQKTKLATQQLKTLETMIATLKESAPKVQAEIDKYYYQCYLSKTIQSQPNQEILVYVVGSQQYRKYLTNAYGNNIPLPDNNLSANLELRPISILSPSWQTTFGIPFDATEMTGTTQFSFGSDFNCLSPSNLATGFGAIKRILSRSIIVSGQDGSQLTLNLGTCTRLQGTNSLPRVGQRIYWRGSSSSRRQWNIYRASCL